MTSTYAPLTFLFLAGVLISSPLRADLVSVAWDNDLLTGTDRGYTNGLRISYLTSSAEESSGASTSIARNFRDQLTFLPGIGATSDQHAVSLSFRQLMVTPDDIGRREPQYNDTPYAGYLSLSSALWSWNAESVTGFGGHVGVVGPESGAERAQKWAHKITGSETPRGWGNQLGTDVVGGLQAAHGRKLIQAGQKGEIEQQVSVVGSTLLSNFRTSAKTGFIWRLGHQLPVNFVPDYAGTSSTISLPGSLNSTGSSWSVFIGLGVEYVAYSYIEENSGPYEFTEGPFIGQIGLGGAWQWDKFQAALTLRATTGEDERHKDNFSFGTLSVSWVL